MKPFIFLLNFLIWMLIPFLFLFILSYPLCYSYYTVVHYDGWCIFYFFYCVMILIAISSSDNDNGMLFVKYPD